MKQLINIIMSTGILAIISIEAFTAYIPLVEYAEKTVNDYNKQIYNLQKELLLIK